MARPFVITSPTQTVQLDSGGRGEISFTVSNSTGRPLRGQMKAKALDSTRQEWLSIAGETERDFSSDGTQQIPVQVAVPAGTSPGKYSFRLDVASASNPDEHYTEGPIVSVDVKPSAKPAKAFPWWIIPVIVGVLGIVAVAGWLVTRKKVEVSDGRSQPAAEAKAKPEESRDQNPNAGEGKAPPATPPPRSAPPPVFQGTWLNQKRRAGEAFRLEIKQSGDQLRVHGWGSCETDFLQECDWGTGSGDVDPRDFFNKPDTAEILLSESRRANTPWYKLTLERGSNELRLSDKRDWRQFVLVKQP